MKRIWGALGSLSLLGCGGQGEQPDEHSLAGKSDEIAAESWIGDPSACHFTVADRDVQLTNTAYGDTRVYDNFSGVAYRGDWEECRYSFVVDYHMPHPAGTRWERGWNWLWYTAAPQDINTAEACAITVMNIQVFSSGLDDPYNFVKVRHINRVGQWNGTYCTMGPLFNLWREGPHAITRIVSQTATGWIATTNHNNYVVTHAEPAWTFGL